jgi:hypothetical protein
MQKTHLHPISQMTQTAQVKAAQRSVERRQVPLLIQALALFGMFLAVLSAFQFVTPALVGNDGYYHIRLAAEMRTQGLTPEFTSLPMTVLNEREFYDHHFLFHVLLIPFTLGDLVSGAKWASIVFASLALLCAWLVLVSQKVPYASWWTAGLLVISSGFLYRMSMPRAQSLSVAVLCLVLLVLLQGRYRWLIPLGFIYVWMYNAFPLMLVLAGSYTIATLFLKRQLNLRPLGYSAAGITLGLVINPYFPHNAVFIIRHLVPKLVDATAIRVGSEWYPYTLTGWLDNALPALLLLVAAFALALVWARKIEARTLIALLLVIFFGFLLVQSRRFIEYFPVFVLIFAAFATTSTLQRMQEIIQGNSKAIPDRLRLILNPSIVAPLLLSSLWIGAALWTTPRLVSSLQDSKPAIRYQNASAFLAEFAPSGTKIFQTDWDDFPRLFFNNPNQMYLIGLDPTYLQIANPSSFNLWLMIANGEVDYPSSLIQEFFGSEYVFTDQQHTGFIQKASADPGLVEVYRDPEAVIFQVSAAP